MNQDHSEELPEHYRDVIAEIEQLEKEGKIEVIIRPLSIAAKRLTERRGDFCVARYKDLSSGRINDLYIDAGDVLTSLGPIYKPSDEAALRQQAIELSQIDKNEKQG